MFFVSPPRRSPSRDRLASMARPPSAVWAVNPKKTSCAGFKPQIWSVDNPVNNLDQHYLRARVLAMKEAEKWA
jgi:hypothetical protein